MPLGKNKAGSNSTILPCSFAVTTFSARGIGEDRSQLIAKGIAGKRLAAEVRVLNEDNPTAIHNVNSIQTDPKPISAEETFLLDLQRNNPMHSVDPHPLLDLRAFVTLFPRPLGQIPSSPELQALLSVEAPAPLRSDDAVREAVRQLLRQGGFKPTGRSKPASEYLLKAVAEGRLASINVAVDACNVVSLHSGLPISVVDLDRARPPFRVGPAEAGSSYVFNASGQTIDLGGLLCLFDAEGPCANAVKDAQRTKTGAESRRTLSLIWSTKTLPGRVELAETWYRSLLEQQGASTQEVRH